MTRLILFTVFLFPWCLTAASLWVPVKEAELQETISLAGPIEPLRSEPVTARWSVMLKSFRVTPGQSVKKGEMIAEAEMKFLESYLQYLDRAIKLTKENFARAKFEERLAQEQQNRARTLASKQVVSKSEADQKQIVHLGARVNRLRAETALHNAQLELETLREQIAKAHYYAPMDGIVTELLVNPKQLVGTIRVNAGAVLARIDLPGQYVSRALAIDVQIAHLSPGLPVQVFLDGDPKAISGTIAAISGSDKMAKDALSFFEVEVHFEVPGPILNRGRLSRVEIPLGKPRTLITLPWNAIRLSANKATVITKATDGTTREIPVVLGPRSAHRVGILSGLQSGDQVEATLW